MITNQAKFLVLGIYGEDKQGRQRRREQERRSTHLLPRLDVVPDEDGPVPRPSTYVSPFRYLSGRILDLSCLAHDSGCKKHWSILT